MHLHISISSMVLFIQKMRCVCVCEISFNAGLRTQGGCTVKHWLPVNAVNVALDFRPDVMILCALVLIKAPLSYIDSRAQNIWETRPRTTRGGPDENSKYVLHSFHIQKKRLKGCKNKLNVRQNSFQTKASAARKQNISVLFSFINNENQS